MGFKIYPPLLATALFSTLTSSANWPACAQSCYTSALSYAGCASTDIPCQCNSPGFYEMIDQLDTCVPLACASDSTEAPVAMLIFDDQCTSYLADPGAYSTSSAKIAVSTASALVQTTASASDFAGVTSTTTLAEVTKSDTLPTVTSSSDVTKSDTLPTATAATTTSSRAIAAAGTETSSSDNIASAQAGATSTSTLAPGATASSTHSGLSSGAKTGIGIGVTLGLLAIIAVGLLAFWYGKRSSKKSDAETAPTVIPVTDGKPAELDPKTADFVVSPISDPEDLEPLSVEEKAELEGRRRAAELQGRSMSPVGHELSGVGSERVELEARRRIAREVFELH